MKKLGIVFACTVAACTSISSGGNNSGKEGRSGDELQGAPIGIGDPAGADAGTSTDPPPDSDVHAIASKPSTAIAADCVMMYTDEAPSVASAFEGALAAEAPTPRLVFLNREGGTYTRGRNDASRNSSSIPSNSTATIDPYEGSDADWASLVSCVTERFADFNVEFTDEDPGDVEHIEAVVGGSPDAVGLGSRVAGVAPFNCGIVSRAVVYTFSRNIRSVLGECETTAHEIGHAFGLEHEFLCEDPMTYLNGCGEKFFQDADASCGTFAPEPCRCGSPTQNTVEKLLANVGSKDTTPAPEPELEPDPVPPEIEPADAVPSVTLVSPADGDVLEAYNEVEVVVRASDDVALDDVRILWEFQTLHNLSCSDPLAGVSCTQEGDLFRFRFPVGSGPRRMQAVAVDSAGQISHTPISSLSFEEPTNRDLPPALRLVSPSAGDALFPGQTFSIRVEASDDNGVAQVFLEWDGQRFQLPGVGGDEFGFDARLSSTASSGPRSVRAIAVDDTGQRSETDVVQVQVQ